MAELVTEMPRSFSSAIQSLVAWRLARRAFTLMAERPGILEAALARPTERASGLRDFLESGG